jgi:hypothetical protein
VEGSSEHCNEILGSNKMFGTRVAERLSASQEGLRSMKLLS